MKTDLKISRKRILIIDDDADLLDILKGYLTSCGHDVYTRDNATEIFSIIDEYRPNLVILDYLLNGINGGEICHEVKNSYIGSQIPVMLYSAYPRVLLSLGLYGCDLFVPKPFDLSELSQSVDQLLQTRSMSNYSAISYKQNTITKACNW
jgi:DNA-binding response OmpR family regulator